MLVYSQLCLDTRSLQILTLVTGRRSSAPTSSPMSRYVGLRPRVIRLCLCCQPVSVLGHGPRQTFYGEPAGTRVAKTPRSTGWAAKFVNMSTRRLRLFWDPGDGGPGSPMGAIGPFDSEGTASFPGHKFYLTPEDNESEILARFVMAPPQAVYYYDPIQSEQSLLEELSEADFDAYQQHVSSRLFGKKYFDFTGREYLALYPRNAPSHKVKPIPLSMGPGPASSLFFLIILTHV